LRQLTARGRLFLIIVVIAVTLGGFCAAAGRQTAVLAWRSYLRPAGTMTGTVFHDYNANGLQDTTSVISNNGAGTIGVAVDAGVAGVTVTAYDANGVVAGTTVSGATGDFSLTVVGSGPYRVEFTGIPAGFQPGPTAPGVKGSSTTVQFVSTPNATSVNLSLVCASQYCQNNPVVATSCFVFGDAVNGPAANEPAIVGFPYNSIGDNPMPPYHIATSKQVGPTFGVAWQRASGSLFASAFMKRHSGFGPGGTGAIYRITNVTGANPTVSLFLDLNALLGAGATGADPHPAGTDYFRDPNSFDAVGKVALGGLKLSEDEQTLYTINLASRELCKIPIGTPPTAPSTAAGVTRVAVPTTLPCSSPNDVRPFGLGVSDGKVYVGTVCTAQSSQNANDLRAAVYAFDPSTNTFNATPVLQFPLNYPRGRGYLTNNIPAAWRPWAGTFAADFGSVSCPTPGFGNLCLPAYPQPILSDIAFDRGAMIIGLRDRYGDQTGREAGSPNPNDPIIYNGITAGDILRAAPNGTGGWTIENNAAAGGPATVGAGNGQGPGGGEYYFDDFRIALHDELGMGSLLQLPGYPDVVSAVFDPLVQVYEGGVRWFSNASGTQTKSYLIYPASLTTFGKANGLGGMAALCSPAPIEIGNRVWRDRNGNGLQDADEEGIQGVTVVLCEANGNPLDSTVTDSGGNYFFNSATVPGGLNPGTNYKVQIDKSQIALGGLSLTKALAGANRAIDSNGVMNGSFAVADVTTGAAGASDHTFDFGFGPEADLAITKTDNRTTYTPGGQTTYSIVVTNNGPSDVASAAVSDVLPPPLAGAAWTCAITAPGSGSLINACGAASGTGSINTTVTLNKGAAATFTLTASINSGTSGPLVNTATVTASGVVETNLSNNTATDMDVPSPEVDLAITKTDGQTSYLPGGALTYTIVASNNGPSDVTGAVVTDNLPATLTGAAWTCAITAPGTGSVINACGAASGVGNINTTVTLRRGAAATFTLTANVASGSSGNLTNTATVSAPPGTTETNTSNNTASDTDTPVPQADLSITKTDGQFNYIPGDTLIYRLNVTNNGPSDVTGATVTDNLPPAVTSATWSCAITAPGSGAVINACGAPSGSGGIATTVTLRSGATASFTLRVRISDNATGAITNRATVTAPPGVVEQNTSNNTASDTDTRLEPPAGGGSDDQGGGGSVLIWPLYTSSVSNPNTENTQLNLTNTNPQRTACVHLFFIDGSNCAVSDSYVCLTPNQTISLLASDVDPGVTGYLIAVAVDCVTGCPVNFNHLIGDEYVKLASGHTASFRAQSVPALQPTANFNCDSSATTVTLSFDNVAYAALPRALALDSIASPADGNSTILVLDRPGGSLSTSLNPVGQVFGLLYNDLESSYSFGFGANSCQFRQTLSGNFPRTTPRLNQVIPAGHTGWMKLWGADDVALIGVAINFNPNAATSSSSYNQGHNLHALTLTTSATLRMPIFPPTC
jgi:uncharacterized repeat protein (TIGR01451 family)